MTSLDLAALPTVLVGTGGESVLEVADGASRPVLDAAEATWLAAHPSLPVRYLVGEGEAGTVRAWTAAGPGPEAASGGSFPCHLAVHPGGGWLYVANYGDGVALAIALDERGGLTEDVVDLPGPAAVAGTVPERQEGPHAHFSGVVGHHLVVVDLGADALRAYPLDASGRPGPEPVLTALPPGTGPRHFVVHRVEGADVLDLTGELSGALVRLDWDVSAGTGAVRAVVPAATLTGGSQEAHYLAHIRLDGERLLVGVRGSDSVSVFDVAGPTLLQEVRTGTWPRHLEILGDVVLVTGELSDELAVHPWDGATLGEVAARIAAPFPKMVLPA